MTNKNLYEEAASEVATWAQDIIKTIVPEVRGGAKPPFKRALTGQEKRDYFISRSPEEQQALWQQMDDTERQQVLPPPGGNYGNI